MKDSEYDTWTSKDELKDELDRQIEQLNQVTSWATKTIRFNLAALAIIATIATFGINDGKIKAQAAVEGPIIVGLGFIAFSTLVSIFAIIIASVALDTPAGVLSGYEETDPREAYKKSLKKHYCRNHWNTLLVHTGILSGFYGTIILIGKTAHQADFKPFEIPIIGLSVYQVMLAVTAIIFIGFLLFGQTKLPQSYGYSLDEITLPPYR